MLWDEGMILWAHVTSLPQTGLGDPGGLLEGVIPMLKGEESWKDTCDTCVVCAASVGCECSSIESSSDSPVGVFL